MFIRRLIAATTPCLNHSSMLGPVFKVEVLTYLAKWSEGAGCLKMSFSPWNGIIHLANQ